LRRRAVLVSLAVLPLVVVAGAGWYLGPIAPVATGYAAKTSCSGHFVSGRTVEDVQGDLPSNPLVPFLRTGTDESAGTVRTSLLGLWPSTAWHTPGLGCTLADGDPGFVAAPRPTPADPFDAGAEPPAGVAAALDRAFAEDLPDGAEKNTRAVVVLQDGQLVAERYAEGFDAETPLLGWSMTKSVANAIVGRLVHEGRLDVGADHLRPEWEGDRRAGLTLEQLRPMASGLAFEEVYDPDTDATNMLFTPGDTGAYAAAKELVADPGTRWSYSSGTTNIICDVAAEAAGIDGVRLAPELVFEPLGMASAVLEPDASGGPVCSSFMYATARDWARFGQWFLQGGAWEGEQLLPEDWVTWSTTPVDLDTEAPYGAQWWLNEGPDGELRMPDAPADAFWASGNEGQQVVVLPSQDMVVVRLGLTQDVGGVDWGLEPLLADLVAATDRA
jgi:CubicO group peptidase (beta-lactamase class C family)